MYNPKKRLFYSTFIKECDNVTQLYTFPLLFLVAASLFGGAKGPFSLATTTHSCLPPPPPPGAVCPCVP